MSTSSWNSLFEGTIEDRPVKLSRLGDSIHLKAETTRGKAGIGYERQGCCAIMPIVLKQGTPITLQADSAEQLAKELREQGFSQQASQEILHSALLA
jgi:hypothetical protein